MVKTENYFWQKALSKMSTQKACHSKRKNFELIVVLPSTLSLTNQQQPKNFHWLTKNKAFPSMCQIV